MKRWIHASTQNITAGTWGPKPLQNDYSLDDFSSYLEGKEGTLRQFVDSLLNNDHECDDDRRMFGVAIVDASVNGTQKSLLGNWGDYPEEGRKFFEDLRNDPLTNRIDKALSVLNDLIEHGVDEWSDNAQASRKAIYQIYKKRLLDAKDRYNV